MPDFVYRAVAVSMTGIAIEQAVIQFELSFFRVENVEQGDFIGIFCQQKSAADSPLRVDDPGFNKRLQNFR